jgi:hypothetical protein
MIRSSRAPTQSSWARQTAPFANRRATVGQFGVVPDMVVIGKGLGGGELRRGPLRHYVMIFIATR